MFWRSTTPGVGAEWPPVGPRLLLVAVNGTGAYSFFGPWDPVHLRNQELLDKTTNYSHLVGDVMLPMSASLADISSNARIKDYPGLSVLQVANAPIFRASGYEPQKRAYDVPPKGKAVDPERAKESSRARAKAAVRDIALCNHFQYFFTWTLSPDIVNRYDREVVGKKVQTFLKNASSRKGFSYICVPEYHKDGAIHFHGLCNLGSVSISRAFDSHRNCPLSTNRGQPIFNMTSWRLGFSTCIPVDENYEAACNYVTKYLSKGADKILGKWYLSSRDLVKRPAISIIDGGVDYETFVADNPMAPVVPIFRDICMAIVQQPIEKGGAT